MTSLGNSEQLDEILTLMPVGLLVTDPEGRIILCNESATQQLAGRSACPGSLLSEVLPELADSWRDVRGSCREVIFLHTKEGRRRPLACQLRWGGESPGQEKRCMLVLYDLSSAYADFGEEQQGMMDALGLMMVAATLHEIANPLFGASAGVELLLSDPDLYGAQRVAVEEIGLELERVTQLADRLRRLDTPQRKTQTTRPLASLISEAIAYLGEFLSKRGALTDQRIPDHLPPIQADNTRVVQVLALTVRDVLLQAPEGVVLTLEAKAEAPDGPLEVILGIRPREDDSALPAAPAPQRPPPHGKTLPLTLSLARAAALNLGGDLRIEDCHKGLCWIIRLPIMVTDGEASSDRR